MAGKKLGGGIVPALLTAFSGEGGERVDYKATRALAQRLYEDAAVAGLYVGGSSGEMSQMSRGEREELFFAVGEVAAGTDKFMIAQVGGPVADAIPLAKAAAAAGADAVSSMTPIYFRYTFDETLGYYRSLAEAAGLPLIVYNIPVYTSVSFTAPQLIKLLDLPGVAGVKFTATEYYTFERVRRERPNALMYSGYDEMFCSSLAMGADGAIGTTFNFMAAPFAKMRALFPADPAAALALQHEVNDVIEALLDAGVLSASKAIVTASGIPYGDVRPPLSHADPAKKARAVDAWRMLCAKTDANK